MLRTACDADFNRQLYRALLRREPNLDMIRVQDVGLRTANDQDILAWSAVEERVLLSHDRRTMRRAAMDRVQSGLPMAGLILVRNRYRQLGLMADEILMVVHCSSQAEWNNRVDFLPW